MSFADPAVEKSAEFILSLKKKKKKKCKIQINAF